jgi:hypothetical protein
LSYRGFWRSQPGWARKVYLFVTVPTWFLLGWFMLSGRLETQAILGIAIITAFAIEAILHNTLWLFAAVGGAK